MFNGMTAIEWVYKTRVRPRIFAMSKDDPEIAHEWGLEKLKKMQSNFLLRAAARLALGYDHPMLATEFCGMQLRHPLGLAAGFDKDCEVYWGGIPACGWAFCEIGGITGPQQDGHPRPRMWRSEELQALGNAMGFNNCGRTGAMRALATHQVDVPVDFYVGLNVGKGKDTPVEQAADEYAKTITALWPYIDFIVLNVSSPNTKILRQLQSRDLLTELVSRTKRVNEEMARFYRSKPKPLGVKPSPDEPDEVLADIIDVSLSGGIDFFEPTNTTVSREGIGDWVPADRAGVSGPPLSARSLRVQQEIYKVVKGRIKIIGVGGIGNGRHAYERTLNGADILELLTAWPFEGPDCSKRCLRELVGYLKSDGYNHVSEAVGAKLK